MSQPRGLRPSASPASRASLRPMGLPRGLSVRADVEGMPVAVTRVDPRGRRSDREARVEQVDEVWRVAEAWWREFSQARTYFRVILEGGRPLTCFRDDQTGLWFEQPYGDPA
ncbi:MAG: hypothetical protein M0R73_01555 [Dehalococcoidia bacterium]|nr:hypothetical protein [Dehalococcoidia bacterium]